MNQLEGILLLIGIPLGLLLAGYWLAAVFAESDVPTRLSISILTGIASLLLAVSIVNFFSPLSGVAAWACLLPVFGSLAWKKSRVRFAQDLGALLSNKSFLGFGAVIVLFLGLLLWPVLSSYGIIMYDGTSNHDSFFWVVVAEHLKRHTYMERPVWDSLQPLASAADAVVGWTPAWGRMGSEGLLALCSAIVGLSPIKLYVYVTACLFLPWLAAVHLGIRTFYAERMSGPARVTVLLLHPIFIFYYSNSNLPNLLGVIAGSAAIIATESALRTAVDHRKQLLAWSGLLALSLHGVYCAYPEMIPFVFLPCGFLWLRAWFVEGARPLWKSRLIVAAAVVVSLLLNPASTFRAGWGFVAVFKLTQAGSWWGSIMYQFHPIQYIPTLVTLTPAVVKWLGIWGSWLLTGVVVVGIVLAWRRSRDRLGVVMAFSGGCVLLIYTLLAHFVYGWQKSVQFTGIFVSAAVAGAIIDSFWQHRGQWRLSRWLAWAGAGGLAVFLAFAVGMQCREIYKWSERKLLSQDWFVLREQSRTKLHALPVLVEAATFRMAFFHGMWAAYFLPDSQIYFASRGDQSGGYLRSQVINEAAQSIPSPAAVLVSRSWADSFDANSERILTGTEYVLLRNSNRVFVMSGVFPLNGPPDKASPSIELEILPHSAGQLLMELTPAQAKGKLSQVGTWQIACSVKGSANYSASLAGPPPWIIKVPLAPGQKNLIKLTLVSDKPTAEALPFDIKQLRIESTP